MNKVKVYNILRILPFVFLLALACIFFAVPNNQMSFASSQPTVVFSRATCENLDATSLTYSVTEFVLQNSSYKRNVTVYFLITNNNQELYYWFGIKSAQTEELQLPWTAITQESTELEVSHLFDNTGTYDIRCYVQDGENTEITDWVTVKCDMDAPNGFATVNSMDEYAKDGNIFNVNFDTTLCADELSEYKEAYFAFTYTNPPKEHYSYQKALSGINTFEIDDNGVLAITYIDNAGNYATIEYVFDKFDKTPPHAPVITIEPDNDTEYADGYAKSYTVTIVYGQDSQSGVHAQQHYVINGVTKQYTAPFKLDAPSGRVEKQTVIRASTVDNVGNVSETVQQVIDDNTFDVYMPIIRIDKISVDLTDIKTHSIRFTATDTGSGVDISKLYIENVDAVITPRTNDVYDAEFSAFGMSSVVLHVPDKAGNNAIRHIVINYFGDKNKSKTIKQYHDLYHSLDFSQYRESVADNIKHAYAHLNTALMADNTQNSQFDALFSKIDQLVAGDSNHSYVINTVPMYISSFITYAITESDFTNYKKGDSIKLVLDALTLDQQDSYVKLAGFPKGFAEAFSLSAYYNEQLLSGLEKGIEITMNLPYNYYERQFVIVDKTTNEIVPSMLYSDNIVFTITDSGDYVMVISGDKSTEKAETKTIKVFGKQMTYAPFFGIIFGTLAGAGVLIGVIIIVKKKKG